MSAKKKKEFAYMMHQMAIADGYLDEEEVNLIIAVYQAANINIEDPSKQEVTFDLSYVYFESSNHNVYEEGLKGSRKNITAPRGIKIEPLLFEPDKYSFTLFNTEKDLTIWGDNIILSPIVMKINVISTDKIDMQCIKNGDPELKIYLSGPDIEKITIEFKANPRILEFLN